ncbi:MAG: hypothetical protein KAG53_11460, partial [Endozoicomonadaceae bacterium]|nr:hypothetical protein [Endozoicomonadaceae bacterium]
MKPNDNPETEQAGKYNKEENRKESFDKWPHKNQQTADAMAKSGFWFTGEGDTVICFICAINLCNWKGDCKLDCV